MDTPTTPTNRLSDAELSELDDLLSMSLLDMAQTREWASRAADVLKRAREVHREIDVQEGGQFGRELRQLLMPVLEKKLDPSIVLGDTTRELSLGVHVLREGVVVDCRLWLQRWQ